MITSSQIAFCFSAIQCAMMCFVKQNIGGFAFTINGSARRGPGAEKNFKCR